MIALMDFKHYIQNACFKMSVKSFFKKRPTLHLN